MKISDRIINDIGSADGGYVNCTDKESAGEE